MSNERLTLEMSLMEAVMAMSEGNPGAVVALADILQLAPIIDPDGAMGGLGAIMLLDTLNIWGSRLYCLWNDVCSKDTRAMIAVLRAWQLGQLAGATKEAIDNAIDGRGRGLNVHLAINEVKRRLPNFR